MVQLPPTKAAAYIKEIHRILRWTSVPLKALQTLVDAFGGDICPVTALARRIANLRGMRASTPLSTVCHPPTRTTRISDRDVTIAVRWDMTYNCLMAKGYTVDRVSSHSLRAGSAMAMKLSGAVDSTIMQIGRWTSLTYLTYMHSQIWMLLTGVAWRISQQFTFQNVG